MKKGLLIFALALTVATSMVAGTLAVYTQTIDDFTSGNIASKAFGVTAEGTDTFNAGFKLAPTESEEVTFTISNTRDEVVAETDMDVKAVVTLPAAENGIANELLKVTVYRGASSETGKEMGTFTGTNGSVEFAETFTADEAEEHVYTVVVEWPGSGVSDPNAEVNADNAYRDVATASTNQLKVSINAVQNTGN